MTEAFKFHDALTAADLEYSGMSWGGFNLFGDRKSIDEAKRLQHAAGTVETLRDALKKAEERATYWQLLAEKKPAYAHMCRDGHVEVGHNDSEHEQCPLCRAQATLLAIAETDGDLSGNDAEHMVWKAKAALSTIA